MPAKRALDVIGGQLPPDAVIINGGAAQYMEVTDTSNMQVWMCFSPVTREDYEALVVHAPLRKTGVGQAPMDCAAFVASPGLSYVAERTIDGRRFIHVATPASITPPSVEGGPMDVLVGKSHVIGFDAGRQVSILSNADGHFVELVGTTSGDETRILPPGSSISQITLSEPWIVHLPSPTKTWFGMGRNIRSFQGPIALPAQK